MNGLCGSRSATLHRNRNEHCSLYILTTYFRDSFVAAECCRASTIGVAGGYCAAGSVELTQHHVSVSPGNFFCGSNLLHSLRICLFRAYLMGSQSLPLQRLRLRKPCSWLRHSCGAEHKAYGDPFHVEFFPYCVDELSFVMRRKVSVDV